MSRSPTTSASPFFIVTDVERTIAFYRDRLGFEVTFSQPSQKPFFAILLRDGAQLFVKSEAGIQPIPNASRHPHLRLDAFIYAPDPDALAADFSTRSVTFSSPLQDTHDGLRGFEITDPDGYVLFCGRPK